MAAQHGAEPASVPFLQPLPEAAPVGGQRVDGRGFEEFRSVCELPTHYTSSRRAFSVVPFLSCPPLTAGSHHGSLARHANPSRHRISAASDIAARL